VIEALERAIRRLEDWSETQAQSRQDALDSGYERFKSWEMLWKTGPISPVASSATSTTNNNIASQLHLIPGGGQASFSLTSPPTIDSNNALEIPQNQMQNDSALSNIKIGSSNNSTTGTPLPHQLDFTHSTGLPQTPHFGFEGFISNFPQELDEFTAIPCFDMDVIPQAAGIGVDLDGAAPGPGPSTNGSADGEGRWMSFMTD
jgi:hypothetical protein